MKFIKWKSMIITCACCLVSILPGIALWNILPESVAIHFSINNVPDNYASRGFAVFTTPALMALLQIVCCIIFDMNAVKHGERVKFERVTKWIIPCMTLVLQLVTFGYALGFITDIRKAVALIVGGVFLVIGNYLPKLDYIKHYNVESSKARKINRFTGFATVIMGILSLISIFLPPAATLVWIYLLIPYAIITVIYGIVVGRGK